MTSSLHELFERSVATGADRIAVVDPGRDRTLDYGRLDRLSDILASDLTRAGIGSGQRVGIHAPKSISSVAAILSTLRVGAAYVPVDSWAPTRRSAEILENCAVSAVFMESEKADAFCKTLGRDAEHRHVGVRNELRELGCDLSLLILDTKDPSPVDGLAYILCTSGSTGKPKGVMHTHETAHCFIDWCSTEFKPVPEDRFSSHAPFHFDLSILDLFVPLAHGASVVLIGEEEGKNPLRLAPLIAAAGISIWYSTPSVLRLLIEHGDLAHHNPSRLKMVLFAGEVFSPSHLHRLQRAWPGRRYFNLYGPTETNVCTYHEVVGEVPYDRIDPYPIGKPIAGDYTIVANAAGQSVSPGAEGELLVHGGTVMKGYWSRPDLDSQVFHADEKGRRWYRTGDVVRENDDGDYVFLGRRDRMIKRRGYRVELGEIEAALYGHPHVREAAVIASTDSTGDVRVRAFVAWSDAEPTSTIALKQFCAENLPLYMVPDSFSFLDSLPKTSTDKIDYVRMGSLDA